MYFYSKNLKKNVIRHFIAHNSMFLYQYNCKVYTYCMYTLKLYNFGWDFKLINFPEEKY